MDRALLVASAAGLVGLGLMAAFTYWLEPRLVPLDEVPDHVGTTARIQGRVLTIDRHAEDWTRGLIGADNQSLAFQGTLRHPPTAGDWVELRGRVERYGPRLQLQLHDRDGLRVLRPWHADHVPLDVLLLEAPDYAGARLVTSGTHTRTQTGTFLESSDGRVRIHAGGPGLDATEPGVFLVVEARLDYDADRALYRLRVEAARPAQPGA